MNINFQHKFYYFNMNTLLLIVQSTFKGYDI